MVQTESIREANKNRSISAWIVAVSQVDGLTAENFVLSSVMDVEERYNEASFPFFSGWYDLNSYFACSLVVFGQDFT